MIEVEEESKSKNIKNKIIYILIFAICLFACEAILRNPLKSLSLLMSTNSAEFCKFADEFDFYTNGGKTILLLIIMNWD